MNFKFKFNIGDKVVVPYLTRDSKATGLTIGVAGEIESLRVYRDKSVLVLVRWGVGGTIHSDWFTEKELKVSQHPQKPRPKPKPKPKPKPRKTTAARRRIF